MVLLYVGSSVCCITGCIMCLLHFLFWVCKLRSPG
uniref:Uncharacterized protein n=1 Tax=Anguilla anguilla TaxID=7936 RepID=A0A0E9V3J7_ANGAN